MNADSGTWSKHVGVSVGVVRLSIKIDLGFLNAILRVCMASIPLFFKYAMYMPLYVYGIWSMHMLCIWYCRRQERRGERLYPLCMHDRTTNMGVNLNMSATSWISGGWQETLQVYVNTADTFSYIPWRCFINICSWGRGKTSQKRSSLLSTIVWLSCAAECMLLFSKLI